jgi:hypothetical protein
MADLFARVFSGQAVAGEPFFVTLETSVRDSPLRIEFR